MSTSEYVTCLNKAGKRIYPLCNRNNLGTSMVTVNLQLIKLLECKIKLQAHNIKPKCDIVVPPKQQFIPSRIKVKSIRQLGRLCTTATAQFALGIFPNVSFFACPQPVRFAPHLPKTEGRLCLFIPVSYAEKAPSHTSLSSQCNTQTPAHTAAGSILHISSTCCHLPLPHNRIGFFRGKPVTSLRYYYYLRAVIGHELTITNQGQDLRITIDSSMEKKCT